MKRHLHLAALTLVAAACAPDRGTDPAATAYKNFAPDISPDGTDVAFYAYRNELPDIFLLNLETGEETQLTNTPDIWEIEPKWSPDGTKLLYGGGPSMQTLRPRIYTPSTRDDRIFVALNRNIGPAEWMPDNASLMYVDKSSLFDAHRFAIVRADGVVEEIPVNLPAGDNVSPNVSPDGKHVAFQNKHMGRTDIYVLDVEAAETWRLTDNETEEVFLTWTRDGRWITYTAESTSGAERVFGLAIDPVQRTSEAPIQLTQGPDDQVHFFSSMSADGIWLYYDGSNANGIDIYRQSLITPASPPEKLTGAD